MVIASCGVLPTMTFPKSKVPVTFIEGYVVVDIPVPEQEIILAPLDAFELT